MSLHFTLARSGSFYSGQESCVVDLVADENGWNWQASSSMTPFKITFGQHKELKSALDECEHATRFLRNSSPEEHGWTVTTPCGAQVLRVGGVSIEEVLEGFGYGPVNGAKAVILINTSVGISACEVREPFKKVLSPTIKCGVSGVSLVNKTATACQWSTTLSFYSLRGFMTDEDLEMQVVETIGNLPSTYSISKIDRMSSAIVSSPILTNNVVAFNPKR
jgi:hypothetical protein